MNVADAQREVRTVYQGGFQGQLVSGAPWLLSAAAATWVSPARGIVILAQSAAGFALGAWITGVVLILFAYCGRGFARAHDAAPTR